VPDGLRRSQKEKARSTTGCPEGTTENGEGTCDPAVVCPDGKIMNAEGQCEVLCSLHKGAVKEACVEAPQGVPINEADVNGCAAKPVAITYTGRNPPDNPNPNGWCGTWELTGQQGSTVEGPESYGDSEDGLQCGAGEVKGEFNGQEICLPGGNTSSVNKTTTTVNNPDGTQTVTETVTTYDAETNTTTTVTTVTTYDGEGNQIGDSTSSEETTKGDSNGTSKFGSYACSDQVPTCTGDAIQCATALQLYDLRCNRTQSEKDAETAMTSNAGKKAFEAEEGVNGGEVNLETELSADSFLGSGTCISDETISLGHWGELTIPWSELCPHLELAGQGLVAVSLILSLWIMIGRGLS